MNSILIKFFSWVQSFVVLIIKWLFGLRISAITPGQGWPGTIITITGYGFSENRDANNVLINGAQAIIVEASEHRLLIVAGENTTSGVVTVQVGSDTATGGSFVVLPYPTPNDMSVGGAPRFFHGPQDGTPKTNVKNQAVLVLVTYPTDHDPGDPFARTAARNDLISRFDPARQYWDEVSYGTTTWNMTYSEWLALPRNRRSYFWQQEDVDDARKLLTAHTHRGLAFDGTRIFKGVSSNGFIPVGHPNPTSYSFNLGVATAGSSAVAFRLEGNRLYAGTASGIIFAYDVTNLAAPALLGSITLPGCYISSIDISGTNLLVAGREGGICLVQAVNPAAMTQLSTINTLPDWAIAVKVSGMRGYVAAGVHLLVVDLSTPMPTVMSSTPLGNWATAIDISGNICAVATDGDGVNVFEITGGGVLPRSKFRSVLRVSGIRLSGTFAHLAANASGYFVVDLANISAPVQVAHLNTTKPCFNLALSGNEVILGLGAEDMLSVTITNPTAPTKNHKEMASGWEPDLNGLQNNLDNAQKSQNLIKDDNALFVNAIRAYLSVPGHTIDPFEGIIVVVNGPFLRGQSWLANDFTFQGDNVKFNHTKGVLYIAFDASITRIAHEIGHWLKMGDIYTEWFADGTYLEGNAAKWCLSGMDGDRPLFCAHQIHEKMNFYSTAGPNVNVVERIWSPTATLNESFDIVAHDLAQDTDPNRIHVLKLKAADGLYYYVEVRQVPIGRNFDLSIPVPAGEPGLVVVTRVTEKASISNTFERPIMLFGELKLGEQVVDAARSLIIKVESRLQDRPLVYRVNVQWNQPIPGDPNGKFDLTMTPWNTDTWETVDIWIDSTRNNNGGGPQYEFHEGTDLSIPRLNGDRPWVKHKNKVYARIRNSGPMDVNDVYVSFSTTSPPGLGDNGQWATQATKKVATVPGQRDIVVDFDWSPSTGEHTCIKISILPQIGEIQTDNNFAQENVGVFDSGAASSCQPVVLDAAVRSPFSVWRKVDLIVRGLPLGWHAVVDQSWMWVEGHGSKPAKAVIWTDYNVDAGNDQRFSQIAEARIEGWTNFDHRYLPIGGFLAIVKGVKKVKPTVNVEVNGPTFWVGGHLTPGLADVPITIEVIDEKGTNWLFYTVTTSGGNFGFSTATEKLEFPKGKYVIKVFVTAGGNAAETEAEPKVVEVK